MNKTGINRRKAFLIVAPEYFLAFFLLPVCLVRLAGLWSIRYIQSERLWQADCLRMQCCRKDLALAFGPSACWRPSAGRTGGQELQGLRSRFRRKQRRHRGARPLL